ncbi:antitoxin [Luteipulveratus sp. YIM 133132]|uniref:Antitoxin n=1 Tax=Luteipulveratus flavus TaxID=3031728 RepID=A0ABT6C8W7_9MICO|nr:MULTISPECIES: antitoxin [unclassified Luteipulveratus]MDE9366280.1 antitoxin [Luteipulveratus sp. YIM 133132]MDF8265369.1 antitoxin [Luteipulveratus sp. YIM 133296]
MGLLDDAKDKASGLQDQVGDDKLQQGVEQGGDFVDDKTGGKYADKVDQGQDAARERLGGDEDADAAQ